MAIIVVVVIALVGSIAVALPAQQTNSTQISKMNTQIDIAHGSALHKGDKLQISLKDVNGKGIANQKLKVSVDDGCGNNQTYNVLTNESGKGMVILDGVSAGNHDVKITYEGNGQYNGCMAKENINIVEYKNSTVKHNDTDKVVNKTHNAVKKIKVPALGNNTNATKNKIFYDPVLNEYYYANGTIVGGQNAGYNITYIKNHPPIITPDGSLV